MSRAELAKRIGVTPIVLLRWETGSAKPSVTAAEKLTKLGFGPVKPSDTNRDTIPRLRSHAKGNSLAVRANKLREAGRIAIHRDGVRIGVLTASYIRNGPPDQSAFHNKLIELQTTPNQLPISALSRRLSLIEEVEAVGETAQHLLEAPQPCAFSWNSNYGTHGWHRYVGRFPPHVVRALLNSFGAGGKSLVCDPFAGSGTTAVECRLLGIPFVGIEICPLSCLMIRTKACFPAAPGVVAEIARSFMSFYDAKWHEFQKGRRWSGITHQDVLGRQGNPIPAFANVERWFTTEALLGVSIAVEYGMSLRGFRRDAVLLALSSRMRSIGNVDVDVVRAEYSKQPRENVQVGSLVFRQLMKMAGDVAACLTTHSGLMGPADSIGLHEGSVLDVDLPERSVDHVITSPPYGIEAISYLRTHLLSYRSLFSFLRHDPYDARDKTIGSEYVPDVVFDREYKSRQASATFRQFFSKPGVSTHPKYQARRRAMMQFFDDMLATGERLSRWVKHRGRVAFIIGNKRLGDETVPMNSIVTELFASKNLVFIEAIKHKLKTNNSNSQVPWQERIIQEESILLFERSGKSR
jgi:hypothetical protein